MTMDIVDIFRDVVSKASRNLKILCPDGNGGFQEVDNPPLNYIFGNSQYIKDTLDVYSQSERQLPLKFPLVALFLSSGMTSISKEMKGLVRST